MVKKQTNSQKSSPRDFPRFADTEMSGLVVYFSQYFCIVFETVQLSLNNLRAERDNKRKTEKHTVTYFRLQTPPPREMSTALELNEAAPLRAACADKDRTIATLTARLTRRERQLTAGKAATVAVETELDALGEELADKDHTIAILTTRVGDLKRELAGANASIVDAETKLAELADKDRIIAILTAHVNHLDRELAGANASIVSAETKLAELADKDRTIAVLRARVTDLERELAAAQARDATTVMTVLRALQHLDHLNNILARSSLPPRVSPAERAAAAERTEEIPATVDHTTTEEALDQQRQEHEAGGAGAGPTGATHTDTDTSFGAPRIESPPAPCGRSHGVSPVRPQSQRGSAGTRRPREASHFPSQESSCCE
jgi:predicted  nucleic acid-binding Zn-ribbon protein